MTLRFPSPVSPKNLVWWCMPAIPALWSWRKVDQKFKAVFLYIAEASLGYSDALTQTGTR